MVSTPIPSAWDLIVGCRSGTIAATFSEDDLLAALVADAWKWSNREYDRARIAAYWRPKLNWATLVQLILGTNEDDKTGQVKEA